MKILSIDSATESATCAVLDDNKLLGEITFNYKKQHSVILMSIIDFLLNNLSLTIKDIDGFVVSKGPGSFTGLRIGASTIKGLSQGSKKPFVAISSLDALANNMAYTEGIICPILDALRNNVYTALYEYKNDNLKRITDISIKSIDDLIEALSEFDCNITFIGDALPKLQDTIKDALPNAHFAPTSLNVVKASSLGELGLQLLKSGYSDNIYNFSPIYIRKSQAEREYDKKKCLKENE
ncbi:tRNA (adenosine(37)-N6)-threonylcarbamoyltransferase complex dimerization subunit type 1 TsaB [Clostridium cochlearium]|uniref:tRNA (adenosine(37)-N6)-threonylcarbamoyltransferase complex dimerization subunit type 1 TsaB n=1 Tax=Clostridium cochlearium TaxID=1494 RepID=UPI00145939AF|nr:tRNA (adenosine(37)-N6)-threonylcarbamoyltransferase complex dimerization subunit type 1 TsaB [Clostridium cochlearium]NME95785.1 tRNA (adenosine(37)-N6)-threonylcarbamoyltransferase complex dimerization subunit type 1 TsaB [Clostridium cochlearium]